jgi:hypothetical protein
MRGLGKNHNSLGPDSGIRNRMASIRIELCRQVSFSNSPGNERAWEGYPGLAWLQVNPAHRSATATERGGPFTPDALNRPEHEAAVWKLPV